MPGGLALVKQRGERLVVFFNIKLGVSENVCSFAFYWCFAMVNTENNVLTLGYVPKKNVCLYVQTFCNVYPLNFCRDK